ncbi:MAG: DUF2079 domain-containing protein [Bacilli bacterium]|nr:DUF2079 domain-containing protein [Bacilli bacterium]MDD4795288.1 DUF2079 domain-containing protein [Bacilli bacterium]
MIKNYKKSIFDNLITIMCSSFFVSSIFSLIYNKHSFINLNFVSEVNIIMFFGFFLLTFMSLIFIGNKDKIKTRSLWCLLLSVILFSVLLAIDTYEDIYFVIGLLILNSIVIYYVLKDDKLNLDKINISNKLLFVLICLGFVICTTLVAILTIYRYKSFGASTYDLGIFAQMFEYLATTLKPLTTLERDGLLSHFAVHFSPIYYFLLPGYYLFRSPEYLLVMQSIFIFAGVFPIYLLCKHKKINNFYTLLICLIYLTYPALTAGAFFDFHENKFLTVLILWMLYFLEKKKDVPMFIFMVLVLMVKEDSALYIMFIGLYKLFSEKKIKNGGKIFFSGILYFLFAILIISLYGGEIMSSRFDNFFIGDGGLFAAFKTMFFNFGYLINEIISTKKLEYIFWMFLPLSFLPIINKKISNLILLVPMLVINLMPEYGYQYNVNFQYTYGVAALLFYAFINNISLLNKNSKRVLIVLSLVSSIYLNISLNYNKFLSYSSYESSYHNETRLCLDKIPIDKSVTATTYLTPYLSKYKTLYMHPSKYLTDYYVVDMRDNNNLITLNELKNKGYIAWNNCGYINIYKVGN